MWLKKTHNVSNVRRKHNMRVSRDMYVDEVPEYLLCPVCREPLHVPACGPCGHCFCKECLEECLVQNPSCPLCRRQTSHAEVFFPLSVREIVMSLRTHCMFRDRGCSFQPMVFDFVKHHLGCKFARHNYSRGMCFIKQTEKKANV